jgi:hypothetical protein
LCGLTWFAIVAAAGDAEATIKRDEIAARLTGSELAAANAAAASYVPQIPDPEANEPLPQNPGHSAARANAKAKVSDVESRNPCAGACGDAGYSAERTRVRTHMGAVASGYFILLFLRFRHTMRGRA